MVNAFSLGPLNFCGDVLASAKSICGINYKTPGMIAKFSNLLANDVQTFTNTALNLAPASQIKTSCRADIKNFYCRLFFPSCNAASELISYNLPNCTTYGLSCPKKVYDRAHALNLCKVVPNGSFRTDVCVKPSTEGTTICPKPPSKLLVPQWLKHEDRLNDRSAQGITSALKFYNASTSCTKRMQQFVCGSQLFCSPDKTQLLTTATQRTCMNALKCLPVKAKLALDKFFDCSLLPHENTSTPIRVPNDAALISGTSQLCYRLSTIWVLVTYLFLRFL
ncbi:uncharacterized protein TRIADDRAFT_57630 [Trichoplax adhaerens]|uniref:FZ domain-containing protein n=1 Tax=Trichoplax adhaerens TaxID=10228 RepID=B3RZZ8_TRIAD|nr:predicted protein [Trichoplax adhaerens]EDV23917.1 predicted protein [Trichoplax adhaerens]|eukprot:XP_002113443.1 predicted protein [Trichoplax adhaerens]